MTVRQGMWFVLLLALVTWSLGQWRSIDVQQLPATSAGPAQASWQDADAVQQAYEARQQLHRLNTFRAASVDGELVLDEHQRLIINRDVRHWFDSHLSALGEISLEAIHNLMLQQIAALPQPGQGQAKRLLQRYLDYRAALAQFDQLQQRQLNNSDTSLALLAQRLEWQQRLRRQYFAPATVAAFFAEDEVLDRYQLKRLQLLAANEPPMALHHELPAELAAKRQRSQLVLQHRRQQQSLMQDGVSDEDLYRWRQQQYGDDAALRLQRLDQRQQQWQQRLHGLVQYQQSLQRSGVSAEEQQQLLQSYQQQHFNASEQKRLPAALALLAE